MANIETGAIATELAKVAEGSQEAMQKVSAASPAWNATLRTTCVATQLEGGHARNALPQRAAANVNCRVLPEDSPEYVEGELKKVVADDQVSITVTANAGKGPASAMRPDVLNAVKAASESLWPGVPVVPTMVMGATDGRYLREVGIPTYGIQGIFFDREDIRFHGRDERVPVQSFYEGQTFMYDLVKALAKTAK
jgi:acetylornithine deacetylase/succinyl-diaminopimelate desuccinylase-like protein